MTIASALLLSSAAAQQPRPKFLLTHPKLPPGAWSIIGGEPAEPQDWPATYILKPVTDVQKRGCTTTVVGERVVLTAAHCIDTGARGEIEPRPRAAIVCSRHPLYKKDQGPPAQANETRDFALCLASKPFIGFPYERIGRAEDVPPLQEEITLLGYGCTAAGGFDLGFGVLYYGSAGVTRHPQSAEDLDIITSTRAAGCYKDSGGAAYTTKVASRRSILAVISRGDRIAETKLPTTTSSVFVEWAKSWAKEKEQLVRDCAGFPKKPGCRDWAASWPANEQRHIRICGVHPEATQCR